MGMQALQGAEGLGQLGVGMNQFGMNMMQGMGNTLGQEGFSFTDEAVKLAATQPNPWSLATQLLGGAAGAYLGGGMKLPGKGGGGGGGDTSWSGVGYNPNRRTRRLASAGATKARGACRGYRRGESRVSQRRQRAVVGAAATGRGPRRAQLLAARQKGR